MTKLAEWMRTHVFACLVTLAPLFIFAGTSTGQDISPDHYEGLRYRHIGPVGNRIASVAGVSGNPHIYLSLIHI